MNVWRSAVAALAVFVAALASGCSSGGTYPVDPGDVGTPPGGQPTAQARVVHAVPDAPNVDVFVDGSRVAADFPYAQYSEYLPVTAGTRNIRVNAAGTSTNVINTNVTLAPNGAYTVIAANLLSSIGAVVLTDDLSAPSAGNVKLRAGHFAPRAGAVDIYLTAPGVDLNTVSPNFSNVTFGANTGYFQVPAGEYVIRITATGSKTPVIDSGAFQLPAGAIRTVLAVGDVPSGKALETLVLDDN